MGAMISEKAALGMVEAQANLQRLGGESLLTLKHLEAGTGFVSPGIIDVTAVSALPDEEYFGPLLQLIRYDDFDVAIEKANATSFGLSAGLLGDNEADWNHFFKRIRAGIVNWNKPITGASSAAPSAASVPPATTGRAPTTPPTTVLTRSPPSKTARLLCRISCLPV